jgi:hypothetical protein
MKLIDVPTREITQYPYTFSGHSSAAVWVPLRLPIHHLKLILLVIVADGTEKVQALNASESVRFLYTGGLWHFHPAY